MKDDKQSPQPLFYMALPEIEWVYRRLFPIAPDLAKAALTQTSEALSTQNPEAPLFFLQL